jgi:hypothetical protein
MIPLPLLPIVAAGLVPLIVGSFWYHPSVFGSRWMSLKQITPEMAERSSRLAAHTTAVMLVLGMCAALILARVLHALSVESIAEALFTAVSAWLGFVVPATINRVLWDHVSLMVYAIETGQWLITLCLMAVVLVY